MDERREQRGEHDGRRGHGAAPDGGDDGERPDDWARCDRADPDTTDEELINMVAQHLPMDQSKRQQLLELENLLLRAQALIELIESMAGVTVLLRR